MMASFDNFCSVSNLAYFIGLLLSGDQSGNFFYHNKFSIKQYLFAKILNIDVKTNIIFIV